VEGEFVRPDFAAPLDDVAVRVLRCPNASVKGMFFSQIVGAARKKGARVGRDRYVPFRDYPLREWIEVLPQAARGAHPDLPVRDGMRRLGWQAFDTFTTSRVGRVFLQLSGLDVDRLVSLAPRGFTVIGSHGQVVVVEQGPGRAVLGLRGMWDYIDAWYVGVFEGAMRTLQREGEVRVRLRDLHMGDLLLTWR
jgi:uncharacterized protein (TIGR02265 family)